jgi:hypothetical protein
LYRKQNIIANDKKIEKDGPSPLSPPSAVTFPGEYSRL